MKTTKLFLIVFSAGILGGILALHFFSFNYIEKYLLAGEGLDLIPIEITERREIFIRENEAITESVKRVERAVVGVRTGTRAGFVEGSGLVVSSDGLLITLSDIIPFGGDFNFIVNGEKVPYEIIKRDSASGLALVKIEKNGLPTLEFGNVNQLELGERVFLVGAVFNEDGEIEKSVNEGVIKRVDNYIETNMLEKRNLRGSTLFSVEGRVLGLNLIDSRGEIYSIPALIIQEFIGL